MDFALSPEEERFREDLRTLLADLLPADWSSRGLIEPADSDERAALAQRVARALGERR